MSVTRFAPQLINRLQEGEGAITLASLPHGLDALILAELAVGDTPVLHIARDDLRAREVMDVLHFFAPDLDILFLPGWDCQPYDRVSPNGTVTAARLAALSALAAGDTPPLIITTVTAALQRVAPRAVLQGERFELKAGGTLAPDTLMRFLERTGFARASTVLEPGDYAVRGGLVDLFAPGADLPVRIDFFGDDIESIRTFDPATQRTEESLKSFVLAPMSDVRLDEDSIARFRQGYVATFGAVTDDDPLYEAVSAGRRHQGMEHWLPLFHDQLETVFDYLPKARLTLDALAAEAINARFTTIQDYYQARVDDRANKVAAASGTFQVPAYKPLKPEALYVSEDEWAKRLQERGALSFSTFDEPPSDGVLNAQGRMGRNFGAERAQEGVNVYEAVKAYLADQVTQGQRVMIASWSEGARDRLSHVLADHGVKPVALVDRVGDFEKLPQATIALSVLPIETGFVAQGLTVLSEQDILGDRLVRGAEKKRRAENFLTEASSLTPGDLVVHVDHGIGRYLGLETIEVLGAPHDCLRLEYADKNTLFLPVENIELLSRYGSDSENANLDKLGGVAWQTRKARLKNRLKDMAEALMKIAARREMRKMPVIAPPAGSYDEFAAAFPYQETEDQARAIDDVIDDFAKGRPMDRLVCGDVGFGKTEVALRAAFVMAMTGRQVAIVVPTTLLARQHYATLKDRLRGWPLKLGQLSRLVPAKEQAETKKQLAEGQIDIVVGTHSLLHKAIDFKDLGLLLIDEEQHFGVRHKERLKELKSDIHVLTLTATPIPRTLQLAMTGVRDLSLIATPPVDRLAVRTFVAPMDPVTIREALLREHYRGGQSFYVCPRISDLAEIHEFLKENVPEVKVQVAHGQMAPTELEDIMTAFYDGGFDVLLSTTIVESGLDIPTANTMILHRADMFGLAQMYQLRGRIGRSKIRGYAYLTVPANKALNPNAEKRLKVLQSLDTLGAGFTLASHDLDLRGAGNLLGEEQSGHIREVGFELYQHMLEEAIAALRDGGDADALEDGTWSPQINLGASVLIPESYVADLDLRMALYRRLSDLETAQDIDAVGAEMIDRFGPLPQEVEMLLKIVAIKALCRRANVSKLDAGPKGCTVTFRNGNFANPAVLIDFIAEESGHVKLRPDHSLLYKRQWPDVDRRVKGAHILLSKLASMAEAGQTAA